MEEKRHFKERGFEPHTSYMEDEAYGEALDNIVVACVDIVVIDNEGKICLGKRVYEPCLDCFWIIGGRMKPGESIEAAAARNTKRELGLNVKRSRFRRLGWFSSVWAKRRQEPKDHGSHTYSNVMLLRISDEEKRKIRPNEEFERFQWVKPEEIISDSSFHPTIKLCAKDLINHIHQG